MLFPADLHQGIRSGAITVALRCWKRPTVVAGGALRSPAGVLAIEAVDIVDRSEVTTEDASAAGAASLEDALSRLECTDGRDLYRIRFHRLGDDPRVALREDDTLDSDTRAEITARLDRWDRAASSGPWTAATLDAIATMPDTVSTRLAEHLGEDRTRLKRRIRQLKSLGLTESLEVGYRLSPRGRAFLEGGD